MNFKKIEIAALHKLLGYLEAVSDFIRTGEIKWYFDVSLYECEELTPDIKRLVKTAYPNSKPEEAKLTEGSIEDVIETFNNELGRFASHAEELRILLPISTQRAGMWQYLSDCIDYEHSRIFEYFSSEQDSLSNGIMGGFAIIFYNEKMGRYLIFIATTSD